MIRATALSKHYGNLVALDQVDFCVSQGEILGFLGPNGAGKSTALRVLSAYLPPTSGLASIAGFDVQLASLSARAHLGYLPEHFVAPSDLRVGEYLHFRARLKGLSKREARQRVPALAERLEFKDRLRQPFLALSKGFRQRIGLADALLADPPALLLDEPFSGLDPLQRQAFRRVLRELAGAGKAILFSSHVLPEVESLADRLLVLVRGRARAVGTMSDLRELFHRQGQCELRVVGASLAPLQQRLQAELGDALLGMETVAEDRLRLHLSEQVDRIAFFKQLAASDAGVVALQDVQADLEELFREVVEEEEA